MENRDYARILADIADLLELQEANPFRVRAYRNAARTLETLSRSVEDLIRDEQPLEKLPDIGRDLAAKITELARTGKLEFLQELHRDVPEGLLEIMRIPGLGPKKTRRFWKDLGITTVAGLEQAAREEKLSALPRMARKSELKILAHIEARRTSGRRIPLADADAIVARLLEALRDSRGLDTLEPAGSFRRRRETVGDLDLLATTGGESDVMDRLVAFPEVEEVLANGATKTSVRLRSGLQVDLRLVERESQGAALVYFTGSRAHGVVLRTRARKRGLKINEYRVEDASGRNRGSATEKAVYRAVGLPWIPPELREDRGEVIAADQGKLPDLIRLEDIRGDLETRSRHSDGEESLPDLAAEARRCRYRFLAVTDPVAAGAGLDAAGLREARRRLDSLQGGSGKALDVLASAEVSIRPDGTLSLPDELLAEMEYVVASVTTELGMPKDEMTRRISRAMGNRLVHTLVRPTGRRVGGDDLWSVDVTEILHVAAQEGVWLGVSGEPGCLDLPDFHIQRARESKVRFALGSGARRTSELSWMRNAVDQCRRGWMEKGDAVNTRSPAALRRLLQQRRR